jgi:acetyl esterase/lipase
MKTLSYTIDVLGGVFSTLFRIMTKGKKRPTWDIPIELMQMSMQKSLVRTLDADGIEWFRKLQTQSSKGFKKSPQIEYSSETLGDISLHHFTPKQIETDKTILFLHGGGYTFSSTSVYLAFLNDLVLATNSKLVSVDYRLAPEFTFPTAHNDVFEAYQHLLKTIPADKIILVGDSAGAGLCTGVLLQCKENNIEMPYSVALISPWVDPYAEGGSVDQNGNVDISDKYYLFNCADQYLKGENKEHPYVKPVSADLTGFPPMLIQIGTAEMLLDQSEALAKKAKADGVNVQYIEYEDLFHTALIASRNLKETKKQMAELIYWIKS